MKIDNIYIIYNKHSADSVSYMKTAAESCTNLGYNFTAFDGYYDENPKTLWQRFGINVMPICPKSAANASASHYALWSFIAQQPDNKRFVILEHDAVLLEELNFDMEDGVIYQLGYKFTDISGLYNRSGISQEILDIEHHEGAHAYALTPFTARKLLLELREVQPTIAIDDFFFIRLINNAKSSVPMKIVSPTPAVGWIRKSTIWNKPSTKNAKIIAKLT